MGSFYQSFYLFYLSQSYCVVVALYLSKPTEFNVAFLKLGQKSILLFIIILKQPHFSFSSSAVSLANIFILNLDMSLFLLNSIRFLFGKKCKLGL